VPGRQGGEKKVFTGKKKRKGEGRVEFGWFTSVGSIERAGIDYDNREDRQEEVE